MNELQIFDNPEFGQIRTIEENGTVLFCGSDVAKALGYSNSRDALGRHCKGVVKRDTPTVSGVQLFSYIPEGDVYRLITHSKLPAAELFESWIFDEVLPSIRKHGAYSIQKSRKSDQELAAADKRAKAMMLNAKCRAVDRLEKLYDRAGVKPEYQALAISDLFAEDGVKLPRIALQGTRVTYDKGTIAAKLGVRSASGLPHAQLIGAIIKTLNVPDSECEAVPYHRNGHDGTDYQYTEAVVDMIGAWLKEQGYPNKVTVAGKTYNASYIVRYAGATG